MKYFGIDYGAKRVGTALSNAAGTIAFPRAIYKNDGDLIRALVEVITRDGIEAIVLGDTRTLEGAANPVTLAMEAFAARLREACALPVFFVREAGSSIAVSDQKNTHDDASAAAFILQRYLDMHGSTVE